MKKLVLVMAMMFMAMICVSFAGNVMASDQPAASAGEEITTDDAAPAQVAVDTEKPVEAEAYSAPEGEDAEVDASEEAPADSDTQTQE